MNVSQRESLGADGIMANNNIPFAFHFRGHEENLANAGKPENLAMKPRATEKPLSEDSHGLALLPYEPGGPALAVGR
jgi:hypothetical protein